MNRFFRLLAFLRPYLGLVFLSILAGIATIVAGIGLMGTSAYLIASAALQPSIADLQIAIVGVRFFGISRGVFRYLERLLSHTVNFRLLANLRAWFYTKIEPQAPACFEVEQSGDLAARAVLDIDSLQDFYVRLVSPVVTAFVVMIGFAWFMGNFLPELGLVLLLGQALSGFILPALAHAFTRKVSGAVILERARVNAALTEWIQGMKDLLIFQAVEERLATILNMGRVFGGQQLALAWREGVFNALNLVIVQGMVIGALLLVIPAVNQSWMDGVLLAVIVLMILAGFEAVLPLVSSGAKLESSLEAARRIFEIADAAAPQKRTEESAPFIPPFSLEVRSLVFRYDPSLPLVLNHLSMTIPAGKKIAVVGPSGSGKSTLVNLLLRFQEAQSGEIMLSGRDVRRYSEQTLRSIFNVLPQNPYFASATLRESLLLANADSNEQDWRAALEKVYLDEWFQKLEEGWDTWLGENGVKLSGGEKQRLNLARLFLRQAPAMIWDEPFSYIDLPTAQKILKNLLTFSEGKSVLWISHQLAGMEAMDEILVLKDGKIVEQGGYHDLLEAKGQFYKMRSVQNRMLQEI